MLFKQRLMLSCALVAATATVAATAQAQSRAATSAAASNTIEELVVTAERREQSLQDVPVAISAFTSERRDLVGINSVQDMTNFTPGLNYSSATDRISLRGVGRLTNAHPIDTAVATYSDGIYTTSTTEAGKTPIFLDRVEVLRGPQGTLYGRNSIGGAINVISRRPTEAFYGEVRATVANFDRTLIEAAVSGPLAEGLQYRLAGNWEKQRKGYYDNVVSGMPDEGNVIDQFYLEGQVQAQFGDKADFWMKAALGGWNNGGGGPGARAGFSPTPFSFAEFGLQNVNAGFACAPGGTAGAVVNSVVNTSPLGCVNPAASDPRKFANNTRQSVSLDDNYVVAGTFSYHFDGADLKYTGGYYNYHYTLIQDNGGGSISSFRIPLRNPAVSGPPNPTCSAAAQAAGVCGPLTIFPRQASTYQEQYWNTSHELNLASTGDGPLQWLGGVYYYKEGYDQPVFTTLFDQPQLDGAIRPAVPAITCPGAPAATCAAATDFQRRLYDDRPTFEDESYAGYGQVDWQFTPTLKATVGLRYSHDKKTGTEAVRIVCFATTTCGITPELFGTLSPPVDVTGSVVYTGGPTNITPQGVVPKTGSLGGVTFDSLGFAHRDYKASWDAWTGTAGLQWDPDPDTMVYGRYSRGYKAGGFNSGITTTLGEFPFTDSEHIDSYEVGLKKTFFGDTLQANLSIFYYNYTGLQAPLTVANNSGALAASQTRFLNVPKSISKGIELETLWAPIDNLQVIFNYSYNDAHIKELSGVFDPDDPIALAAGAKPLSALTSCTGTGTTVTAANPRPNPLCDVNTGFVQRAQDLSGNSLPQAAKNKVAVNVSYTWDIGNGSLTPSVSYIWRDKEYSGIFQRDTNASKAWDQVDARVLWKGADNRYTIIAYVKNVFDELGYAGGAGGARTTGTFAVGTPGVVPGTPGPVPGTTFGVQGGPRFTYALTPPRTYGVEVQYRF